MAPAAVGVAGLDAPGAQDDAPPVRVAGVFVGPNEDPCPTYGSDFCADALEGHAACVGMAVGLRGFLASTISRTSADTDGGPLFDHEDVVNVGLGIVTADVAYSTCEADPAGPSACGEAETGDVTIDLNVFGLPAVLHADVLYEQGCTSPGSGSNSAIVTGLSGEVFGVAIAPINVQPGPFSISFGSLGFLAVNEQTFGSSDQCAWNTGAALRLYVNALVEQEVLVSWVSTKTCPKLTANIVTEAASVGPCCGEIQDVAIVSGTGPTPTGTVAFFLCGPLAAPTACVVGGSLVSANPLVAGVATSDTTIVSANKAGWYCYRAEYSGDAVYAPAVHSDDEAECINQIFPQ